MTVSSRRLELGVAQKLAHDIDGLPRVHQIAGKCMAQIMHAQVSKSRLFSHLVPWIEQIAKWQLRIRVRNYIKTPLPARQTFQHLQSFVRDRDVASLATLGQWNAPVTPLQIKVLPLGIQQLTLAASEQQQQGDNTFELSVITSGQCLMQTLGFSRTQIPLLCVVGSE